MSLLFPTKSRNAGSVPRKSDPPSDDELQIPPDIRASAEPDGVVFLNVATGAVFASNAIGSCIWKGLEDRLGVDIIARKISEDYGLSWEEARQDTAAFLASLEANGLLFDQREH
jgi:hypothetical protein